MIKMPLDFNVIKSMARIIWWESILGKRDEKMVGPTIDGQNMKTMLMILTIAIVQ